MYAPAVSGGKVEYLIRPFVFMEPLYVRIDTLFVSVNSAKANAPDGRLKPLIGK